MIIPAQIKVKRGFTLIELLIVIAILGILAAAVLVAINPAKRQRQARDSNIKSDVGQIATGLQAYFTSSGGTYPSSAQGLAQLVTNGDLRQIPANPGGGAYTYAVIPAGCAGTVASACTEITVSNPLEDPAVAGNVWCFRSATGDAAELALAACIP